MPLRLDELPEELVSNISTRLHADDISPLRLTCRALEKKSRHEFATEYLSQKGFFITTQSLRALVAIAKSEKLRGHLQDAYFLTDFFSENALKFPNGCQCASRPSVKQDEVFCTFLADQRSIKRTGTNKNMLREAFASLPSLRLVSMVDSLAALPPNIDVRGKYQLHRLTGRLPGLSEDNLKSKEYDAYVRHIWEILMEALAESKISCLDTLTSQIGRNRFALSILDVALMARPEMKLIATNLKTLALQLRTNESFYKQSEAMNRIAKILGATAMKHAGRAMSSLTTIDLMFDSTLLSGLYFTRFAQNLNLEQLNNLYLDSLDVQASSSDFVLCRLKNVKDLRLTAVNLTKGSWLTILGVIQKLLRRLTHLHLMYLMEAGRRTYFLKDTHQEEYDNGAVPENHIGIGDSDEDRDLAELESFDDAYRGAETLTAGIEDMQGDHSLALLLSYTPSHIPSAEALSTYSEEQSLLLPNMLFDPMYLFADLLPATRDQTCTIDSPQDDFIDPEGPDTGERGYYVCLKGEQIAGQLPRLIEGHNLGEDVEDELNDPTDV